LRNDAEEMGMKDDVLALLHRGKFTTLPRLKLLLAARRGRSVRPTRLNKVVKELIQERRVSRRMSPHGRSRVAVTFSFRLGPERCVWLDPCSFYFIKS
jgi:hypothetical protein